MVSRLILALKPIEQAHPRPFGPGLVSLDLRRPGQRRDRFRYNGKEEKTDHDESEMISPLVFLMGVGMMTVVGGVCMRREDSWDDVEVITRFMGHPLLIGTDVHDVDRTKWPYQQEWDQKKPCADTAVRTARMCCRRTSRGCHQHVVR